MMLRRLYVNARLERYARVLEWLETGHDLDDAGSPFGLSDTERAETHAILDGPVYGLTAARSLLLRLDQLLADEGSSYNHSVVSIEHVLPQTPPAGSEWFSWFPQAEQRASWTHRLGNLVLLSRRKNSRASNYEFRTKKDIYFRQGKTSTFALTAGVLMEDEWTPVVVERRQAALVKVLVDEWKLG